MKRYLKQLLGERNTKRLIQVKLLGDRLVAKWFPTKEQREFAKKTKETLAKRVAFYSMFLKKGDLCFDVGANMGNRIDPVLAIGARVLAVEPQRSCYEHLQRKYGKRITLITKGLGSKEEVRKFYISNMSQISSFSEEWIDSVKTKRFSQYNWNNVEEIEMTTLDRLIAEHGVPAFIKIDVEGYELEVLKGLNSPIRVISFEYTIPEQRDRAVDCLARIEALDAGIECNYSKAESMSLALERWLPASEMKEQVLANNIGGWGDMYVRSKRQD